MAYDVPPPKELPQPGYYYHFKHDPNGPVNNYAYYIYGVGHHTEGDCREADTFMQVYRPLYEESYAFRNGGLYDLRPLHMFYDPATLQGRKVPRFTRITDPAVISPSWPPSRPGCTRTDRRQTALSLAPKPLILISATAFSAWRSRRPVRCGGPAC